METRTPEQTLEQARDYIKSLHLNWTLRSVEYVVNREGYTLNQLRSAAFIVNNQPQYDIERSARILIAAGLINASTVSPDDYTNIKNKAVDICEEWRKNFGYIGVLQLLIVETMAEQHFFTNSRDAQLLTELAKTSTQTDVVQIMMAEVLKSAASQDEAYRQ